MTGRKGVTETFSYARDVQPIFDRHCVKCHDFNKKAGKKLLLAGDKNCFFNASYIDIQVKNMITCVGGGPADIQQAYSWGASQSKIIKVIENGHKGTSLNQEEMKTLNTWIDLNGVYYPEYECAFPNNPSGRSPISHDELKELGKLTGIDFYKLKVHSRKMGPQLSFDRPELSPCLDSVKSPADRERVLEILALGQERLQATPRCDMDGFVMSDLHKKMLARYDFMAREAEACRLEIVESQKQ